MRTLTVIIITFFLVSCTRNSEGDAVAKVNGHPIPLKQFEELAGRIGHIPGKKFENMADRKELLNDMIQQDVLYQAAIKDRLTEKSERLQKMIAQEYLSEKIGRERYEPSGDEVKAYFEAKKNHLEKVRVSHIYFKPKNLDSQASIDEARKRAEAVFQKSKAGEDFAKLAKQFSDDVSTKSQGGDLGYIERSKMPPEFSNAAFALKKPGDVSGVVTTQDGFHIIKLISEQRSLEMFQDSIKWQLAQEHRKQKAEQLLKKLREDASVQVYDDVLAKAKIATSFNP